MNLLRRHLPFVIPFASGLIISILLEEALLESEEKYRGLFNAVFEGILVHDKGKVVDFNSCFAEMYGYSRSELIGMNAFDLIDPESLELVRDKVTSGFEGSYEAIGVKKNGSRFIDVFSGKREHTFRFKRKNNSNYK